MTESVSIKTYLRTSGDTVNHVFDIPYDFTGYACGVMQISSVVTLKPISPEEVAAVAIAKAKGKKVVPKGSLYLCCDICEESFIGGVKGQEVKKLPVLRELPNPTKSGRRDLIIPDVLWVNVTTPFVKYIRLYIVNEKGEIPTFKQCNLKCTVLFWKPRRK